MKKRIFAAMMVAVMLLVSVGIAAMAGELATDVVSSYSYEMTQEDGEAYSPIAPLWGDCGCGSGGFCCGRLSCNLCGNVCGCRLPCIVQNCCNAFCMR